MEIKPNNVYLGDAYDLIKKAPTGSVNLCYFDPPYSMSGGGQGGCFGTEHRDYHTQYKHLGTEEHKDPNIQLDSRSNSNCVCPGFDYSILDELERVMIKTNIYIWCSKDQISSLMSYYERKGYNVDLLVFHKVNPIPTCNNKYLSDLEYCVFARAPGTPLYGSYATKSKVFTSATNKDDKDKYKHPTIKPLEMVKNHIINSSQPGDVVLDIFMGSGTTCVAAKQLDRKYIGFEIDEKWYNVAKDRLDGWDQNGQMDLLTYNI